MSKVDGALLDQVEADVYWCLTKLLDNIQVQRTLVLLLLPLLVCPWMPLMVLLLVLLLLLVPGCCWHLSSSSKLCISSQTLLL